MKLHPLKCELLCISNKCVPPKFDYVINGSQLDWHTSIRYLGVHITSTLSWNVHCSKIFAKLPEFSIRGLGNKMIALKMAVAIDANLLVALRATDLLLTPTPSHDHILLHCSVSLLECYHK